MYATEALVLAALLLAAPACLQAEEDGLLTREEDRDTVFSIEDPGRPAEPALPERPPAYPIASESLEPNRPAPARARRSTVVFRPLFATRERDAERREQQERRREYWAKEERRRSAQAVYPGYPAPGYPAAAYLAPGYPAAYRPYASYPTGR